MAMADNNGNNSTVIPEEDRLGVVLPRYLAGYVDTISQAVQRIAGHMTTGVAQFPNIISIVPLQVVGHFAGQFTTAPGPGLGLGVGFSNIFTSGAQVFGHVANELASGLQLQIANNNSVLQLQGTGNDDDTIQMPPNQDSASMDQPTQQLARDIWKISVPTLVIAIGTALYKPASGVLFRHHPLAYYCGLAAIFVAGVGETLTAYWLACSRDANGRHFTIGKAVWWASIVPLIFILGIGGCHVIVGY